MHNVIIIFGIKIGSFYWDSRPKYEQKIIFTLAVNFRVLTDIVMFTILDNLLDYIDYLTGLFQKS